MKGGYLTFCLCYCLMAHPYHRAVFDLRGFSKIQSHIVPNENFQIYNITTDSVFKDAFEHCFECFVDLLSLLKKNIFEISHKTKIARW